MPSPKYQGLAHTAYDADGVTTTWNFNFSGGYLDATHVKAYTVTNGTTTFRGTVPLAGPYQALIVPAVPVGTEVHIYRDTPKDLPIVDFTDGSGLTETALDTNAKQAVFLAAEASDYAGIGSAALAVEAADNAATSAAGAATSADNAAVSEAAAVAAAATVEAFGSDAVYCVELETDGVTSAFTLPFGVVDKNLLDVSSNGVTQNRSAYSVAGYTLTLDEAPAAGSLMVTLRKSLAVATDAERFFWIDTYGAVEGEDNTLAIQAAIDTAFAAGGGVVMLPAGQWRAAASNIVVKRGVSVVGPVRNVSEHMAIDGNSLDQVKATLYLAGARTIEMRSGSSLEGLYIVEDRMRTRLPLTTLAAVDEAVAGFTGTAITVAGQDVQLRDLAILGFNQAVYSKAIVGSGRPRERHKISRLLLDCTNGVHIERSSDITRLDSVHCFPVLNSRVAGTTPRRTGAAFRATVSADALSFHSCFSYGWDIGFDIQCQYGTMLVNCAVDGASLSGAGQVGYKFSGSAKAVILSNCMASGLDTGAYLNMTDGLASISFTGCEFHGNRVHLNSVAHRMLLLTGNQFNSVWAGGSASISLASDASSVTQVTGNVFSSGLVAFSVSANALVGFNSSANLFTNGTLDTVGDRAVVDGTGGSNGNVNYSYFAHNSSGVGAIHNFSLSRGTAVSPTATTAGAQLFRSYGYAYTGAGYAPAVSMRYQLDDTASPGNVKGKFVVSTNSGGALTDRLEVTASGTLRLLTVPTSPAGLVAGSVWRDGGTLKIV